MLRHYKNANVSWHTFLLKQGQTSLVCVWEYAVKKEDSCWNLRNIKIRYEWRYFCDHLTPHFVEISSRSVRDHWGVLEWVTGQGVFSVNCFFSSLIGFCAFWDELLYSNAPWLQSGDYAGMCSMSATTATTAIPSIPANRLSWDGTLNSEKVHQKHTFHKRGKITVQHFLEFLMRRCYEWDFTQIS